MSRESSNLLGWESGMICCVLVLTYAVRSWELEEDPQPLRSSQGLGREHCICSEVKVTPVTMEEQQLSPTSFLPPSLISSAEHGITSPVFGKRNPANWPGPSN